MLKLPCDIFIPAAVPDVIDENVARQLNCRYVVEAANGPTTVEGDKARAQLLTDLRWVTRAVHSWHFVTAVSVGSSGCRLGKQVYAEYDLAASSPCPAAGSAGAWNWGPPRCLCKWWWGHCKLLRVGAESADLQVNSPRVYPCYVHGKASVPGVES